MKSVEFYTGTNCVQFCFSGYNWLVSLSTINDEAAKLQVATRRVCKAVGVHTEYTDYSVTVCFDERKIFVSIYGKDKDTCKALVREARKRHFKVTIGEECCR